MLSRCKKCEASDYALSSFQTIVSFMGRRDPQNGFWEDGTPHIFFFKVTSVRQCGNSYENLKVKRLVDVPGTE